MDPLESNPAQYFSEGSPFDQTAPGHPGAQVSKFMDFGKLLQSVTKNLSVHKYIEHQQNCWKDLSWSYIGHGPLALDSAALEHFSTSESL